MTVERDLSIMEPMRSSQRQAMLQYSTDCNGLVDLVGLVIVERG